MKFFGLFGAFATLLFGFACQSNSPNLIKGYDLNAPLETYVLPKSLVEVSGAAYWKKDHVALVQDEDDIVFIYDLSKKEVIDKVQFHKDGDHEGIASNGEHLFVLRSDGDLFKLKDLKGKKTDSEHWENGLAHKNDTEGLCYDADKKRFLITCKGEPGNRLDGKFFRTVWSVNARNGKLSKNPLFVIDKQTINDTISARLGVRVKHEFAPSAIEIHPLTKELWMLSARGNLLVVYSPKGALLEAVRLDERMYKQPEALTFTPEGDLLIANEGRNKNGVMYRFSLNKL